VRARNGGKGRLRGCCKLEKLARGWGRDPGGGGGDESPGGARGRLVSLPTLFLLPTLVSHTCLRLFLPCRYGFGVGGEYPMASSSAAERSEADDRLRHRRGEQVVLVFSGQVRVFGMAVTFNTCGCGVWGLGGGGSRAGVQRPG
jgi:MFS family permease